MAFDIVHYLYSLEATCRIYRGPESSFGDIEFAPLKSPLRVKPGAFVELST
jgi:hypothetical protein